MDVINVPWRTQTHTATWIKVVGIALVTIEWIGIGLIFF